VYGADDGPPRAENAAITRPASLLCSTLCPCSFTSPCRLRAVPGAAAGDLAALRPHQQTVGTDDADFKFSEALNITMQASGTIGAAADCLGLTALRLQLRFVAKETEEGAHKDRMLVPFTGLAGFGQYLVLLPVIRGLAALRLRLRDNATCMKSLHAFEVTSLHGSGAGDCRSSIFFADAPAQ